MSTHIGHFATSWEGNQLRRWRIVKYKTMHTLHGNTYNTIKYTNTSTQIGPFVTGYPGRESGSVG